MLDIGYLVCLIAYMWPVAHDLQTELWLYGLLTMISSIRFSVGALVYRVDPGVSYDTFTYLLSSSYVTLLGSSTVFSPGTLSSTKTSSLSPKFIHMGVHRF